MASDQRLDQMGMLRRSIDEHLKDAVASGRAEVKPVSCLGRCDAAPAVAVNDVPADRSTPVDPAARAACVASCPTGAIVRIDPGEYVDEIYERQG